MYCPHFLLKMACVTILFKLVPTLVTRYLHSESSSDAPGEEGETSLRRMLKNRKWRDDLHCVLAGTIEG